MTTPWRVSWDEAEPAADVDVACIITDPTAPSDTLTIGQPFECEDEDWPDEAVVQIVAEQERQTATVVVKVRDLRAALKRVGLIE